MTPFLKDTSSAEGGSLMSNPLLEIQKHGQSAWLDYIHRDDLANGDLQRRIDEEGILGVTSNPSIFQKAIGDSDTYDDDILTMLDLEAQDIYESLAIEDIQNATDLFRPIYDRSEGGDGYVSLEVSPLLARDTQGTIDEARRLFNTVDRPNLMIKIPATPEGIPAIEASIAAGINVNVHPDFRYQQLRASGGSLHPRFGDTSGRRRRHHPRGIGGQFLPQPH